MSVHPSPKNLAREIARRVLPKKRERETKQPKRLSRNKIRQLKAGESLPPGEPKRYRNQQGYIRLRWLVGPQSYVEVYEHRVFDGVVTDAEHVHHINHDRSDNRPENLERMTMAQHAQMHGEERKGDYGRYRSRHDQAKAERAEANRERRTALSLEMRALYEAGYTTVDIATKYGIDSSGVSRRLRQVGTRMRGVSPKNPTNATRAAVRARAQMRCERCAVQVTWQPKEIHHLRNRSQGGPHTPANLALLCLSCHGWVTTNPEAAHAEGFHLENGEAPGSRPIDSRLHGRVFLTDDGRAVPAPIEGGAA